MLYGGTYPLSFDWAKELLTQWHNYNLLTSKRYVLSKAQVFKKKRYPRRWLHLFIKFIMFLVYLVIATINDMV